MFKKVLIVMIAIALCFSVVATGYAAEKDESAEKLPVNGAKYTYITSCSTNLSIKSNGYATSTGKMMAYPGVDSVRISMYLQRYDNGWKTVQHWAENYTGVTGSLTRSRYVTSGYSYRVLTYFYAYDGSNSEGTSLTNYESY